MKLARLSFQIGAGVASAGAIVLAWRLIHPALATRAPTTLLMGPHAAVSFVLQGLALMAVAAGARRERLARVLATTFAALAVLQLAGLAMHRPLGFDRLLALVLPASLPPGPPPGYAVTVNLCFGALALAVLAWRRRIWAADAVAGSLAVVSGVIGAVAAFGYAVGEPLLFGYDATSMSLASAAGFVGLAAGIFAAAGAAEPLRDHEEAARFDVVLPLEKKFSISAGIALGVIVVMGLLSYHSSVQSSEAGRWIERTQQAQISLETLLAALQDAETGERGYLLTGRESLLEPYYASFDQIDRQLRELVRLSAADPARLKQLDEIAPLIRTQLQQLKRGIDLKRDGHAGEAVAFAAEAGQRRMDSVRHRIALLQDGLRAELTRRAAARETNRRRATVIYAAVIGVVGAILLGVHFLLERDLSGRRHAIASLRRHNDTLRSFAHTVAHDLRAPLRGISGYARELSHHHAAGLDERGLFCIRQIGGAAANLDRLIEDTLQYARLDAEVPRLDAVDLPLLVAALLRERAPQIREYGAEITTRFGITRPVTWERGFTQVLGNLFDNALKYSRPARPPRLHLETAETPGGWTFTITDNGIGFDPKHHDRIFGLFQRLDTAAGFEGTGAGLAIVKKIVTRLGGTVRAESAPGAGATFIVELPKFAAGELA